VLLRTLLLELMAMFQQGPQPLPHNIFPVETLPTLSDTWPGAKHQESRASFNSAESKSLGPVVPRADATYLITRSRRPGARRRPPAGGKGARHLVLLSRSGASSAGEEVAADVAAKGPGRHDSGRRFERSDLAPRYPSSRQMPPLRG
jgi:hypothetical protein